MAVTAIARESFEAIAPSVWRTRLAVGDAWIEVSYGSGVAHGAALSRVYGQLDPLVQAQVRLKRSPVAHVCYLLVPTPRKGIGSELLCAALEERPKATWFAVASPDTMPELPALLRFYGRQRFAQFTAENPHYLRRDPL